MQEEIVKSLQSVKIFTSASFGPTCSKFGVSQTISYSLTKIPYTS